jgi:hypothetical protein
MSVLVTPKASGRGAESSKRASCSPSRDTVSRAAAKSTGKSRKTVVGGHLQAHCVGADTRHRVFRAGFVPIANSCGGGDEKQAASQIREATVRREKQASETQHQSRAAQLEAGSGRRETEIAVCRAIDFSRSAARCDRRYPQRSSLVVRSPHVPW